MASNPVHDDVVVRLDRIIKELAIKSWRNALKVMPEEIWDRLPVSVTRQSLLAVAVIEIDELPPIAVGSQTGFEFSKKPVRKGSFFDAGARRSLD